MVLSVWSTITAVVEVPSMSWTVQFSPRTPGYRPVDLVVTLKSPVPALMLDAAVV